MARVISICLGIVCLLALLFSLRGTFPHKKFNSDTWKYTDMNIEKNWDLRWKMMNSLRNNYELEGMTSREIIELLGQPDDPMSNEFTYYLGYTGMGINTGSLHIYFDKNKRVNEIRIRQG